MVWAMKSNHAFSICTSHLYLQSSKNSGQTSKFLLTLKYNATPKAAADKSNRPTLTQAVEIRARIGAEGVQWRDGRF